MVHWVVLLHLKLRFQILKSINELADGRIYLVGEKLDDTCIWLTYLCTPSRLDLHRTVLHQPFLWQMDQELETEWEIKFTVYHDKLQEGVKYLLDGTSFKQFCQKSLDSQIWLNVHCCIPAKYWSVRRFLRNEWQNAYHTDFCIFFF